MSEHALEVNKAANGFIALVLGFEGVLKYFGDIKLIKVRTLNCLFAVLIFHNALESFFFGGGPADGGGCDLLLFLFSVFLEASVLLLLLACIHHFLFHFFNEVFHLLGGAPLFEPVVGMDVGAILQLILF